MMGRALTRLSRFIASAGVLALAAPVARAADVVEYYHLDAIGNVRVVTDQAKNVIERHDYFPFGEECTTGSCASNPGVGAGQPRKFTGKERDSETGLDYFGARYYSSKIGRFTTVDPLYTWNENLLDPQRWNRYSYVRNSPLRYVDPDGRGTVKHIFKLIAKGGDIAATAQGVADDAAVLFSANPTVGTGVRLIAAASLTSELLPVSGRDVKEGAELALRLTKRGPKPKGVGPHNLTIDRRIGELKAEGMEHIGGGSLTEEVVPTPGGCKSCRRPDITMRRPDGTIYRENVGRTRTSGEPATREVGALDDLDRATGERPAYTPYDRKE